MIHAMYVWMRTRAAHAASTFIMSCLYFRQWRGELQVAVCRLHQRRAGQDEDEAGQEREKVATEVERLYSSRKRTRRLGSVAKLAGK